MKPTLKIDFWISNVDSRAHSWPCRPVPAKFQLTATYWHKCLSNEHMPTCEVMRYKSISTSIRVTRSLWRAKLPNMSLVGKYWMIFIQISSGKSISLREFRSMPSSELKFSPWTENFEWFCNLWNNLTKMIANLGAV